MDSKQFGMAKDEKELSKSDFEGKRKRRSKNEQEGRNFKCVNCGKSYLSQPALTNHNKTKHHQDDPNFQKRGRGRPRKNPTFNSHPEKDIQKFKLFFQKDERRRKEGETCDLMELSKQAYHELNVFKGKIFKNLTNVEDHPILKELESQNTTPSSEIKTTCDQIFAQYALEFFHQTTANYYIFLLKFVTLFRECINSFKTGEGDQEFTQTNSADSVPDLCNEFITEFMENNDNFHLETTEVIEVIQHFCNWLYESKYTTSRLTLLS